MGRLHHQDFYGWTQDQADALRRRSANEIDWEKLQEEIEGLGASLESELTNRLIVLLTHLLKWRMQPLKRSRSWTLTVREQRRRIKRLLDRNPGLAPKLAQCFQDAYPSAVDVAADQTGLLETVFAPESPLTFDEAMDEPVEWPDRQSPS